MEKRTFKYIQGNQTFYSTVMTFKEIIENSFVSIYSRDNRLGYQRTLIERHLKKIVVSLKTDDTPISPTSILLGIDEDNLIESSIDNMISLQFNRDDGGHIFRIVDGQHRIMAMKKYIDELTDRGDLNKLNEINSYEFSVIIMPISIYKRIKEVEVFQSINAKAKPLKTDLIKLALTRYQELEKINQLDYTNHLANRIIFSLNDNKPYNEEQNLFTGDIINVWENAIIIDVNNDDEIGVIGYSAFYKSIEQICKFYTSNIETNFNENTTYEELDKHLNMLSNELTFELFVPCWKIIMDRWKKCFSYKKLSFDFEIYYNEEFYIQKNMGLRSLHNILYTIIKSEDVNIKDYSYILNQFREIIYSSKLIDEDWKKGGRFKGLSSEAGFKHIENIIKK
ncbi:DGQHR domain-containing protein [Bacillus wiedmannii]|uniref:DGQHR domain-containing protein n=2 Tax=Bacillus wiedmannii TaxID=1890302 RepID=UPI001D0EA420|nr:DGQHR domain-containing protein [Bacillus wiedmannii]MCC2327158.1 DGQHR domain-containing protein [Bacillus wiedmannii]MED2801437.1 DGQHR domain-containing protein [Bacillus thuringiensis]